MRKQLCSRCDFCLKFVPKNLTESDDIFGILGFLDSENSDGIRRNPTKFRILEIPVVILGFRKFRRFQRKNFRNFWIPEMESDGIRKNFQNSWIPKNPTIPTESDEIRRKFRNFWIPEIPTDSNGIFG